MESILLCLGVVVVAWGLMNTREIINWRGEAKSQGTGKIILQFSGEPKYITNKLQGTNCKYCVPPYPGHPVAGILILYPSPGTFYLVKIKQSKENMAKTTVERIKVKL